jgi:hypothetical protein
MLKFIIQVLLDRYGIYAVNDALAQIFDERIKYDLEGANFTQNKLNDELSEAYDNINRDFFRLRET